MTSAKHGPSTVSVTLTMTDKIIHMAIMSEIAMTLSMTEASRRHKDHSASLKDKL